jgi:hypothetical protein
MIRRTILKTSCGTQKEATVVASTLLAGGLMVVAIVCACLSVACGNTLPREDTTVKLNKALYAKVKKCAKAGGYSSPDEFVEHVLEKELPLTRKEALEILNKEADPETIIFVEVTGISDDSTHGWKDVDYTYRLNEDSVYRLAPSLKGRIRWPKSGVATFRYYDDGWRVERVAGLDIHAAVSVPVDDGKRGIAQYPTWKQKILDDALAEALAGQRLKKEAK